MGSVIFDFDSTLVTRESLESYLAAKSAGHERRLERIEALTNAGMNGAMSFRDSIEKRLGLVDVRRDELEEQGEQLVHELSEGTAELIADLHARGHEVWILSGAFDLCLWPVARTLGIAAFRVRGVSAHWREDGSFHSLDDENPFCTSKLAGALSVASAWSCPRIGVGDGMTDYALFEEGLLDKFFLYTEHVRREPVAAKARDEVNGMLALRERLLELP